LHVYESGRRFKFWDYRVSHNYALLRAPHTNKIPTNLDLVFGGVEYLSLPTAIDGLCLEVRESGFPEFNRIEIRKPDRVFRIQSPVYDYAHWVVAAFCCVIENRLDFMESSLDAFLGLGDTLPGTVLARL